MTRTALHVAPHPDDEVLGCGATLLALQRSGWRVVNLTCSLGRPPDRARRRRELDAALEVLGLEGVVAEPPVAMSASDDLDAAEARVVELVLEVAGTLEPQLVLAPHRDEAHPGHAVVGRAVVRAAEVAPTWWAWGLWRDLPGPNRYVPFGEEERAVLSAALECHAGELARNRYAELLPARARAQAVLGSERVAGFGSGPLASEPYADLLEEWVRDGSSWKRPEGHAIGLGPLGRP